MICLRDGTVGKDVVLIDPQSLSNDGSKTVSLLEVSDDGSLLVYGIRTGGEDEVEVRFYDVAKRTDRAERLPRGRYYGLSLTADNKTLFYSHYGRLGSRIYRRAVESRPEEESTRRVHAGRDHRAECRTAKTS